MDDFNYAVIGGGIVGLATAMALQKSQPGASITVLELEPEVGLHQSGHNSGVVHSGIYYQPGSLKARLCRSGKLAMEAFCQEHDVPLDRCGKVIVATNPKEVESLERIADRGKQNGVDFQRLDTDGLRNLEPSAAGIAALHVPGTGIVNYREVCKAMSSLISLQGGIVQFNQAVVAIDSDLKSVNISTKKGDRIKCDHLVNCGGLHCDRLYRMAGGKTEVQIVPFRGEYYELAADSESYCRNLIYPVPDPSFPFLGVHFTRMIDGGVECGPNAVLAFARHGYRWRDVDAGDLFQTIRFAGFRRLAAEHWRMGLGEIHRSVSKSAFVRALQKLIPKIQSHDLITGRSGVRAQAMLPNGKLVDDFMIESTQRATHVLNAPSPAATASIAIGEHIANVVLGTS